MYSDSGIETYPEYQYSDSYIDICFLYASVGMMTGMGAHFLLKFLGWIA